MKTLIQDLLLPGELLLPPLRLMGIMTVELLVSIGLAAAMVVVAAMRSSR